MAMTDSHRLLRAAFRMIALASLPALLILACPAVADAHSGGMRHDLLGGLLHPLTGLDHLAAMLAVGLWGAQLGGRSRTSLFLSFLVAMLLGSGMAFVGVRLPLAEPAIAASVFLFGMLVALAIQTPTWACATIAAAFALFHGYAHGMELGGSSPAAFVTGFLMTTAGLILVGHSIGTLVSRFDRPLAIRVFGVAIALFGVILYL